MIAMGTGGMTVDEVEVVLANNGSSSKRVDDWQ